jgi:hypothetical protein
VPGAAEVPASDHGWAEVPEQQLARGPGRLLARVGVLRCQGGYATQTALDYVSSRASWDSSCSMGSWGLAIAAIATGVAEVVTGRHRRDHTVRLASSRSATSRSRRRSIALG